MWTLLTTGIFLGKCRKLVVENSLTQKVINAVHNGDRVLTVGNVV